MKLGKKIRYAVVGQGYISQVAILPAFKHGRKNSELVALVSSDQTKLRQFGRRYGVKKLYTYDQYDECLRSGDIDAVFIALPNHMHRDFSVRAAKAGIHVLCEKPMAITSSECQEMIDAADQARIKLMIAYRLHFEQTNLEAIETIRKGKIGEPRYFSSVFSFPVKEENIRTKHELGGGPLHDIGIYCINAARYLFGEEPIQVSALACRSAKEAFKEIDETVSVTLRFPGEKLASFVCSFGAASVATYRVVGTKGDLRVDNAYEFVGEKTSFLTVKEKTKQKKYKARDQFGPELLYFSECVLKNREPEPSGWEGLADIRIIEAIFQSLDDGKSVAIEPIAKTERPGLRQEIKKPAVKKPELVKAEEPSKGVA